MFEQFYSIPFLSSGYSSFKLWNYRWMSAHFPGRSIARTYQIWVTSWFLGFKLQMSVHVIFPLNETVLKQEGFLWCQTPTSTVSWRMQSEEWRGGGQWGGGWYHKFVYECNLNPLVIEGCVQNSITLVQTPTFNFFQYKMSPSGMGCKQIKRVLIWFDFLFNIF